MISGHQVSHSKDNMSVMIQVAFSLLFITLVRAADHPANLDGRQTSTAKCGLQDPTARRVRRNVEVTHAELSDKIVGGVNVDTGKYPWMVTMGKRILLYTFRWYLPWYQHVCSASIITKDWLLTAAHCFFNRTDKSWENETSEWIMKLGADHYFDVPKSDAVEFNPSKIIIHQNYDPNGTAWDVALVKMPSEFSEFTTRINTVCLHECADAKPSNGTKCILAGWGGLLQEWRDTDHLMELEVYILDGKDAKNYCGDLDPGMLCAALVAGGEDTCTGNSGDALFCPVTLGGTTRYYQAGVASFGRGCFQPNTPSVCTDVSYFLPWIKQTISAN